MSSESTFTRAAVLRGGAATAAALAGMQFGATPTLAAAGRKPVLTIAMPANPDTIDPHQFRSVLAGSMLGCVMETLLTRDPQTMELRPLLATAWRDIDPHTWEFKLRRNVRFSNGEPFDAQSVKFSLERILKTPLNTLGKTVWPPSFGQEVTIVDPYTVRISTKTPDPLVPNRLAAESMGMVPPKAFASYMNSFVSNTMIGTGPYTFVEYAVGERFVVQANPHYWGVKPTTERIVWQVIPDPSTRVDALQRGSVDVIANVPFPLIATVESASNLTTYSKLGSIIYGYLLDANANPKLKDKRVRMALNHAIDRQAIINTIFKGKGQIANGVVAKQVEFAADPQPYAYDPAKAKALLAEAGLKNGFSMDMWQATDRWSQAVEASQAIAGYLQAVGVTANLQTLQWADYNARTSRALLKDAAYYGFVNGIWDPEYVVQRFLPSYPTFRYYDASGQLAGDLTRYGGAFPHPERRKLAHTIQQQLHEDAVWMFLWQLNETYGLNKNVHGFKTRQDDFIVVRDAYVLA